MQNAAQILDWAAWAPGLAGKDDWREAASLPSFGLESSPYAPPGAEEPPAKAAAIPAMLRRRLTPLGRALAEVLGPLAAKAPDAPWVYASRWGDAALATELLTAAVRTHLPDCAPDGGRFCRMALYRADGTPYR